MKTSSKIMIACLMILAIGYQNCGNIESLDSINVSDNSSGGGDNEGGSPTPPPATPPPGGGSSSGRLFPDNSIWYQDISNAPVDSESTTILTWLGQQGTNSGPNSPGGWGNNRMQVDFSFTILERLSSTPMVSVVSSPDGYYLPDCDPRTTFPLPVGGAIEGESGYSCNGDGDCHILVIDRQNRRLYESYRSNLVGNQLQSMCIVTWDLTRTYTEFLRGDQCTSTDAAGFPVAPLLFTADEIAAGEINHAIRFILPNARMRRGVYVRPATHAGAPSGPAQAVPYGARLRLKASFNVNSLKPAARIVARAMQKYGILLADGGNIALTAASDRYTITKWSDVDFGPLDLASLKVSDFEMIAAGERISLTYDCERIP